MNDETTQVLSEIINTEDNEDCLRRLMDQLKSDLGVIPFVGAGFSIPMGFPGWSKFLYSQAKKAGIAEAIQESIDSGMYEDTADELLRARGYRAFQDAVDNTFGSHRLTGKTVKGPVTYLPQLTAGPIITTNLDYVLEETFKQAGHPFKRVVWGAKATLATRAFHQGLGFLLKIHGDAEDSTDRVLTKSDYEKHYGSEDGTSIDFALPLPNILKLMLTSRPLLFLGCSLTNDRTMGVLNQIAQDYPDIAHYAIVEKPSSPDQFHQRSRFLSNHSIRPIWYPLGRHCLIEPLIKYLIGETRRSTSLPSPRVWLDNKDISTFIDDMTTKVVLIMGRFTPERKVILDTLREELRNLDYTPVLFDFEAPSNRSITETLSILAHLSRFIIVDLTSPSNVPQELARIVPALPSVPVLPIIHRSERVFPMFGDLMNYPWVMSPVFYEGIDDLLFTLTENVIAPGEEMFKKIREDRQSQYEQYR